MKIINIFLDAFVIVVHLFSDFLKLGPRNWTKTTYMRVQCSLGYNNFKIGRSCFVSCKEQSRNDPIVAPAYRWWTAYADSFAWWHAISWVGVFLWNYKMRIRIVEKTVSLIGDTLLDNYYSNNLS